VDEKNVIHTALSMLCNTVKDKTVQVFSSFKKVGL
jgi:hypothetical protein